MGLQHCSHLLQDRNRQFVAGSQTQGVAVIADMPMGTPGASRDAPLMMSRQAARLPHKAKRGLLGQPDKPLWGIGLKREQAPLGTEHDLVTRTGILDQR